LDDIPLLRSELDEQKYTPNLAFCQGEFLIMVWRLRIHGQQNTFTPKRCPILEFQSRGDSLTKFVTISAKIVPFPLIQPLRRWE
ncbi:MAG: hypothetical protein NT023_23865, partial [Armatimonadetes bacterium]|nr:hypothetical protein [Armatimonadota bacterium]